MKRFIVFVAFAGVLLFMAMPALAVPLDILIQEDPSQDLITIDGWVHELGDGFPIEERIESTWQETSYRPCFENPDTAIPNIEVTMTNRSGQYWENLHYVGDAEALPGPVVVPETLLTNYDGFIGQAGVMFTSLGFAFKIDDVGANRPLVSESMTPNLIFEPGETWVFVIQDFVSPWGGTAAPLDSYDAAFGTGEIAGMSFGGPPSTGSIIAVPEPATLSLLALGSVALLRRRR